MKVARVVPLFHGNTRVEFENNSSLVIPRGSVDRLPFVGEEFPPKEGVLIDALDQKASEEAPQLRESVNERAANEDEIGTTRESKDGPREEGQ